MLQTYCLWNSCEFLELDEVRVGKKLLYLLAILNVDVCGTVLVMLDGEAVSRFGTLAADTLHLRTNLGITEIAEVGIRWNDFAM